MNSAESVHPAQSDPDSPGFRGLAPDEGQPPLKPGDVFAPSYVVVDHLRRGDRLDVYDLWSQQRECRCVAKTLRPEFAEDRTVAGRLHTENMLLTTLTHPNLVRGYGSVLTNDPPRPAVLSETLPGHTVSFLIEHFGRLRPIDTAVLGIQLCSVLGYMHRTGWVHADVKPSNVVEVGGRAVLLDLSLVCRIGEPSGAGTFDYLSPEQARAEEITEAADVWGLGVSLYEALAGQPPWAEFDHTQRDEHGRRTYPQLTHPAAALRTHRRLPAALSRLVDACLTPDPRQRPTLTEVREALVSWSGADPRHVPE